MCSNPPLKISFQPFLLKRRISPKILRYSNEIARNFLSNSRKLWVYRLFSLIIPLGFKNLPVTDTIPYFCNKSNAYCLFPVRHRFANAEHQGIKIVQSLENSGLFTPKVGISLAEKEGFLASEPVVTSALYALRFTSPCYCHSFLLPSSATGSGRKRPPCASSAQVQIHSFCQSKNRLKRRFCLWRRRCVYHKNPHLFDNAISSNPCIMCKTVIIFFIFHHKI